MQAQSPQFTAMVEGVDQTYAYQVTIALPNGIASDMTATVESVEIEQSIASDVPDGASLVEGIPSATATFTLGGLYDPTDETKTVAWLFNPYSTGSPLYRTDAFKAPVVISLGLYPDGAAGVPELVRKFVGYVDEYASDMDQGTVAFTCIDIRTNLRSTITLPAVVTAPPYNAGLTSEFAIDYLLRGATDGTISSWPALRSGTVLAIGMRSSMWPEVGTLNVADGSIPIPTFAPGAYGTGVLRLTSTATGQRARWNTASLLADTFYTDFLYQLTGNGSPSSGPTFNLSDGTATNSLAVDVPSTTTIRLTLRTSSDPPIRKTVTIPDLGSGPHHIGVLFSMPVGSTAFTATVYVDDAAYPITTTTTSAARNSNWQYMTLAAFNQQAVIAGLQVSNETAFVYKPFTPGAVLDQSLNPLQIIPPISGDPWQVIQQIVQAELGVAGFLADPDTFRFYNRATIRGGASVRDVRSTSSLKSLDTNMTAAAVINRARVGWTPYSTATTATFLFEASAATRVPARGSTTFSVTLESLGTSLDLTPVIASDQNASTAESFYRASTDQYGTAAFAGTLTFSLQQTGADEVTVTVTNPTNADAWLVSPGNYTDTPVGTPFFKLSGLAITPGTEVVADWQYPPVTDGGAAGSRFGEIVTDITGLPWLQDADTAQQLAVDIVCASEKPIPVFTDLAIVPDPRLQLTDRVHLVDPDVSKVDEYAHLIGLTTTLSANDDGTADYSMSITARAVTFPGGWILGVPGRSELGATTYL